MNIMGVISKLRKSSIILFCLSFIALIGTLLLHNIIVSFKFSNSVYPFNLKPGTVITCDETNGYCNNILDKKVYASSLENCNKIETNAGVFYKTTPLKNGPGTARCFIFVTPDAQRTMNTYIGACSLLSPKDIEDKLIRNSKITFLEGYLWEEDLAKESLVKAAEIARNAGNKVALTLSDPFCVEKHRNEFKDLIKKNIDILFANEFEAKELCQTKDLEESAKEISSMTEIVAITRSKNGAKIYNSNETVEIKAKVFNVVKDTTGAGDLFAAGFLYGLINKFSILKSGKIASLTAAEIISHFGARPEINLADLIQKKLTE